MRTDSEQPWLPRYRPLQQAFPAGLPYDVHAIMSRSGLGRTSMLMATAVSEAALYAGSDPCNFGWLIVLQKDDQRELVRKIHHFCGFSTPPQYLWSPHSEPWRELVGIDFSIRDEASANRWCEGIASRLRVLELDYRRSEKKPHHFAFEVSQMIYRAARAKITIAGVVIDDFDLYLRGVLPTGKEQDPPLVTALKTLKEQVAKQHNVPVVVSLHLRETGKNARDPAHHAQYPRWPDLEANLSHIATIGPPDEGGAVEFAVTKAPINENQTKPVICRWLTDCAVIDVGQESDAIGLRSPWRFNHSLALEVEDVPDKVTEPARVEPPKRIVADDIAAGIALKAVRRNRSMLGDKQTS